MAARDIEIHFSGTAVPGAKRFKVNADTTGGARIKIGELVFKSLGNTAGLYVTQWTAAIGTGSAAKPSVGTDYIAGLAISTSTETATASGTVDVLPNVPGMFYECAPNDSTLWDTQAEYDALVGARVKLNYAATTGKITVLATDWLYNGAVVEPLNIFIHPNRVRFSLRQALNYFA